MPRFASLIMVASLALLAVSCARLPHYARPVTVSMEDIKMEDVIFFRDLQRSDFKGEQPPPGFDHRMAAAICVYVQPELDFTYLGHENGSHVFQVSFGQPAFRAVMDRDCSWWNSDMTGEDTEYILEHEGIHFALFEIAARDWSENIPWRVIRVTGEDEAALIENTRARTDAYLERRMDELMQRTLEFDEETSAVYDPGRQKQWLLEVREELAASAAPLAATTDGQCGMNADTRAALAAARKALRDSHYRREVLELVEKAQAAALAPECDQVRATILADKAIDLAANPEHEPCRVDYRATRAIDAAETSVESAGQQTEARQLLRQARAALRPPECDSVRARILADKARQLSAR